MPTVIIGGVPPDTEKRVRAAARKGAIITTDWTIGWVRSKGHNPGLAPSQLDDLMYKASELGGAHILIFRSREIQIEALVATRVAPYFRVRWLDKRLLTLIPHSIDDFNIAIADILKEELEWNSAVKPQDESSCLLLPECAFAVSGRVKNLWGIASQSGSDRIRGAVKAVQKFRSTHWMRNDVRRAWIDEGGRVFDHHGARHGVAPFPRSWKFSYHLPDGFHFDVTASESRGFTVMDWERKPHTVPSLSHVNIDPHGYIR